MAEELELDYEEQKPSKNSKQVTMKFTGSFTVDGNMYEFKAGEPFSVSPKHYEAFEREIRRRGLLDGSITN